MTTFISRFGTERKWIIENDNILKFIAYDVSYCNSNGTIDNIISIDPDGGPYIEVGSIITIQNKQYKLIKIISNILNDDILTVKFETQII